jgi:GNAT superfamily N-acetyltransferase
MYNKATIQQERSGTVMSEYTLRPMEAQDKESVIRMMRGFYASEAVHTNGSEEVFNNDVDACVSDNPYASGYVFVREDGSICGYSMLSHSYSTEYGRYSVWIEDLFLEEDARGKGLSDMLFDYVKEKYPDHIHRLEVEETNLRAIRTYKKNGFKTLPYAEMIREPE